MQFPALLFRLFFRRMNRLFLGGVSVFFGVVMFTMFSSLLQTTEEYLQKESAEMMGGELRLSYFQEITSEIYEGIGSIEAEAKEYSYSTKITGMLRTESAQTVAQIKIVDSAYPILGEVTIKEGIYRYPAENEIYIQSEISDQLNVQKGETLFLGEDSFTVAGVLDSLPDIENNTSFFGATAVISPEGFEATKIDRSASRVSYLFMARFDSEEQKNRAQAIVEENPPPQGIRMRWAGEEGGRLFSTFETIEAFLSSFLAMLLFFLGVSTVLGITLFFQEEHRNIARMKAFGMDPFSLITFYGGAFFLFFLCIGSLASLSGEYLSLFGKAHLSEAYLPKLEYVFSFHSVIKGIYISLLFFLLSFLWNVSALYFQSPRSLLRSSPEKEKVKIIYLFRVFPAVLILFLTLFLLFPDTSLAFSWFASLLLIIFIGGGILSLLIKYVGKIKQSSSFSLINRAVLSLFEQPGSGKKIVFLLFFLAFFSLNSIWIFGTSIQAQLDTTLEEDSPTFVLLDIQKDQLDGVQEVLSEAEYFPIVRGRFLEINGEELGEERRTRRMFNMTYREDLLETEKMLRGQWWEEGSEESVVSLEQDFATEMNIYLGDTVTFDIQGIPLSFTVTNIREIQENRFSPWFIFVTPEKALQEAPSSYIGFSWIPTEEISDIQKKLTEAYPNITSARTEEFSLQLQKILSNISLVVALLTTTLLIAGFFSFVSMLLSDAQKKRRWFWRFHLFGAPTSFASQIFARETFFLFGAAFISAYILSLISFVGAGIFFSFLPPISFDLVPFLFFGVMSICGIGTTLFVLGKNIKIQ